MRHHTEHRFARRHEAVWVAVDSTPLYNDRDRQVGYIRIVADIKGNRLAAEALRESDMRYRNIFENGLGFLCTHDLDGRLLSITPAAAGALGFTPEELTGRALAGMLAPSVRDGFAAYLESIRRGERSDGLMRLLTRQGEERFWMYRDVLHSPLAGPPYVLGFAFDITDSRRARNKLAASERRFRQFLEASGDMIQSLNAEGTLNYVNRRWREVLGYSEEEVRCGACIRAARHHRLVIRALPSILGSRCRWRHRRRRVRGDALPGRAIGIFCKHLLHVREQDAEGLRGHCARRALEEVAGPRLVAQVQEQSCVPDPGLRESGFALAKLRADRQ